MPSLAPLEMHTSNIERPFISKWNAIFDRTFLQYLTFKPKEDVTIYPCYSCRDMFSSKDCFLDHVNRRGMLITYSCPECSETLKFYNPCSFLLHTRKHYSTTTGIIDLKNVTISLLPLGLAGFFKHPDVPILYDVEEERHDKPELLNSFFYSPLLETQGKRIVILKPIILLFFSTESTPPKQLILKQISSNIPFCKFVDVMHEDAVILQTPKNQATIKKEIEKIQEEKIPQLTPASTPKPAPLRRITNRFPLCPECKILQRKDMMSHFHGNDKPTNQNYKCNSCGYIAATYCSLTAHQRLHRRTPPFICPECGKNFDDFEDLQNHLEEVCFHLAKNVRFRCLGRNCSKIFATSYTFATHFPTHLLAYTKCLKCNVIFESESKYEDHQEEHQFEVLEPGEKLYKCTVCLPIKNNYLTKDNYWEHVNMHSTDYNQRVYVYNCKSCRSYFRSRMTYAMHILKCTKNKREMKQNNIAELHSLKPGEFKVNCILCNKKFTVEDMKIHLDVCENPSGKNVERCPYQKPVVVLKRERSPSPQTSNKKNHLNFSCKICMRIEGDRYEFHSHIKKHRDGMANYQCMECGECFITKASLVKHINFEHQIEDIEKYLDENECCASSDFEENVPENVCRVCRMEFSDKIELDKHFRVHGMAFLLQNNQK